MALTVTGSQLLKDLGLSNFKYIWVQRGLSLPISLYVVTLDSRFPNTYLSIGKVKNLKSNLLKSLRKSGFEYKFKDLRLTPPLPLSEFSGLPDSNSMWIIRDIAGEYYRDSSMFSHINENINRYKIFHFLEKNNIKKIKKYESFLYLKEKKYTAKEMFLLNKKAKMIVQIIEALKQWNYSYENYLNFNKLEKKPYFKNLNKKIWEKLKSSGKSYLDNDLDYNDLKDEFIDYYLKDEYDNFKNLEKLKDENEEEYDEELQDIMDSSDFENYILNFYWKEIKNKYPSELYSSYKNVYKEYEDIFKEYIDSLFDKDINKEKEIIYKEKEKWLKNYKPIEYHNISGENFAYYIIDDIGFHSPIKNLPKEVKPKSVNMEQLNLKALSKSEFNKLEQDILKNIKDTDKRQFFQDIWQDLYNDRKSYFSA